MSLADAFTSVNSILTVLLFLPQSTSILSSAERSGARIEGCELARIRRIRRTLRYDLRSALRQAQDEATVYSGCCH